MTLRTKLLLSPAPLALALVLLGLASVQTLTALGGSPELILKDNYRSVLAAERMMDAVEQLQEVALARAAGRGAPAGTATDALARRFEDELVVQEHNLTEEGEPEATRRLRESWTAYRDAFAGPEAGTLDGYFAVLAPRAAEVRRAAGEVLDLNQDAMSRKSERARRSAGRSLDVVVVATVAALALGVVSSLALTARLLGPLRALSQSVRRIAEGDLEARARVAGKDEIADLAREFNAMADHLAEYRKSSLGELLQAQQGAQAAIDSLPDPVLVLDAAGAILNVNGAAESLLHVAAGEDVRALEPGLREVAERVRAHVLAGRGAYVPRGYEEAVRVTTGDGGRHLLPRATPLYSEEGGISAATVVLQDVTRLMRFDELKNDLVATVAHEFRTPLTSLRMAIHLLAEEQVGPLNVKQADLVAAAREECERLQGIVDDLLDLSRIQAGRMELQAERIPAGALLELAAAAQRPAADEAGLDVAAAVPADEVAVSADRERIQLVLGNLVANAIRHTPHGGRVTLSAAPAGDLVRFEVTDTGEGIAPEYQERIFEKFFRVPGAREGREGGVGLGLYLAREIVQAHGGDMGVRSAPGQGSTFWFTLPRAPEQVAGAVATG
jgi:signal transduction histidine kinase